MGNHAPIARSGHETKNCIHSTVRRAFPLFDKMPRTTSLWGRPPSRFYRYLSQVEAAFPIRPLTFSILGCSDGKFVLPLARKGHTVHAVDIDALALFGGEKTGPTGPVQMPGLVARLQAEGLSHRVTVAHSDFIAHPPDCRFHAVFTSGAIQYSHNLRHDVHTILSAIKSCVRKLGFLYFDYMLPLDATHCLRPNYFKPGELRRHFQPPAWRVLRDRVLPPLLEKGHVDNPCDHYHHWGHMCVRRLQ